MYRIMIIEDDQAMEKQIRSWGNECLCVRDFQNILPVFVEYDLIDNVVMDSEFYSVENHSHLYNSSVGNTVNRDALNYGLNQ